MPLIKYAICLKAQGQHLKTYQGGFRLRTEASKLDLRPKLLA